MISQMNNQIYLTQIVGVAGGSQVAFFVVIQLIFRGSKDPLPNIKLPGLIKKRLLNIFLNNDLFVFFRLLTHDFFKGQKVWEKFDSAAHAWADGLQDPHVIFTLLPWYVLLIRLLFPIICKPFLKLGHLVIVSWEDESRWCDI